MKFPKLIHVTVENEGRGVEPWLMTHIDGVNDINQPQDVAVYQLISVGRVRIQKQFIANKRARS